MALQSVNPATGEVIQEFTAIGETEIEYRIDAAHQAWRSWRETSFDTRADCLNRTAGLLRERSGDLGRLITLEMGKTHKDAVAEVQKCSLVCEYYAEHAATFLAAEAITTDASKSYARFDPIGIVLAVMPWNFPFWQVFRFAAPALMAGNVGLLKHASNVQICAQAIEDVLMDGGFPPGTFANLPIGSDQVESIIRDSRISAVTLTGSEYAGSQVASVAGEVIKKTVLELGGSDPFIVLADADVEQAAQFAMATRLQFNAGQRCISAKRFIVHKDIAEAFTSRLCDIASNLVVGDPFDDKTQLGPLSSAQTRNDIERQVKQSVDAGARLVYGGTRPRDDGFYYAPAILTDVGPGMAVYDEEVFGPVLPVITFVDEAEAIRIANESPYGLSSSIFSGNADLAENLAQHIASGSVFINGQVKSDPRLPFGGVKQSGYGRELSVYGIKEFVNIKTVWIK